MPFSSRFRQWAAAVAVGLLIVSATACSSDSTGAAPDGSASTPAARTTGAGMVEATFVDTSRPTPRSRDLPAQAQRTLATTIYYPTASGGPGELVEGAVPDTSAGPYPLLVFAHGLGANPTYYEDILREVAASGFVVVAPAFPLTSSQNPGGPDAGDTGNQPGDVSFLVDTATSGTTPEWSDLAGLVDPDAWARSGIRTAPSRRSASPPTPVVETTASMPLSSCPARPRRSAEASTSSPRRHRRC